jgi:hypothetical protein
MERVMVSVKGAQGARSGLALFLAALLLAMLPVAPARAEAEQVKVVLDQAKLVPLPDRVATLVIGNPLIVDAALQVGGTMVLTGKGYGVTNVLALDRNGNVVMEKSVRVSAPNNTVIVYRGMDRHTYSCEPKCERQVVPGDAEAAFNLTLGQTVTRNTQAQGAAR